MSYGVTVFEGEAKSVLLTWAVLADRDKSQEKRSGVFISAVWSRQGLHDREALRSRYASFEHVQNKRSGIVADKNRDKVVKRA
jgi:hypothetical protein